ncbi:hypothetical protein Pse7367_1188 [Thalassoporum mexicanum PCC 7367]|uniref:hypothetical protein n=1 Tax=Thalassoporum mexicanum TaxID=3457544 RepID=UPI00029FD06C|nr:hypothetical protein [Pseudanabaena sp. PCC 7367]AFY69485.1 hypothetical protein Pse7367_1188 [Pseudanabaena sp. PCC 7367]
MTQRLQAALAFVVRIPIMLLTGVWLVAALILSSIQSAWRLVHVFIGLLPETYQPKYIQVEWSEVDLAGQAIALSKNTGRTVYILFVYAIAVPVVVLMGLWFSLLMPITSMRRWWTERSLAENYLARSERGESIEDLGAEIDRLDVFPGLRRKLREKLDLEIESETDAAQREQILAGQFELIENFPSPQLLKQWLKSMTAYRL